MPPIYVNYLATGLNDGSTKADAFTSGVTALAAAVVGDSFVVSHLHTETDVVLALAKTSTDNSQPYHWVSTDFATDLYRKSTISNFIATTESQLNCNNRFWGLNIESLNTANNVGANGINIITDGRYILSSTEINKYCIQGTTEFRLVNSDLVLGTGTGSAALYLQNAGMFSMLGGTITGRVSSNWGLMSIVSNYTKKPSILEDVDLSTVDFAGGYLVKNEASNTEGKVQLFNCKMPALPLNRVFEIGLRCARFYVELINSDISGQIDHYRKVYGEGSTIESDTSVYLNSGFTQAVSGLQLSHKITTTVYVTPRTPIDSMEIVGFSETTGAKTLRVQVAHDFTNPVKLSECYLTSGYFGTAGSSHATFSTTSAKVAGTLFDPVSLGADVATSTAAWTGAAGLTLQQLDIPVVINETGIFTVQLHLGKFEAGKVLHYNPNAELI